ncbi:MAG: redox-regulated ATPase YchF [Chloroflexi bacterium]|nr:redox-regulated ATPase YchF [Chloroflexota bacterium]
MQIAIIGLPSSGKTTIFNALTGSAIPVGQYAAKPESNIGVAHVPDDRVDKLTELYKPKRTIYAEVTYVDIPGQGGVQQEQAMFDGAAMGQLQKADALLHVVRAFDDDSVIHSKDSVDWRRDAKDVEFDIMFSDIALIDRRIEKLSDVKNMKAVDRDAQFKLIDELKAVQAGLEDGIPVRSQSLTDGQQRGLQDQFLVSSLPYLVAVNIGEDAIPDSEAIEGELGEMLTGELTGGAAICGSLEMELSQMDDAEEAEFRSSLGAGEPGLHRILRLCYESLGLMSFLTVGEDEVRAWTIPEQMPAAKAAGVIHSDIERGFIRGEIVSYEDLMEHGTVSNARTAGKLRSEGREYLMQNGDVVNFLFSV